MAGTVRAARAVARRALGGRPRLRPRRRPPARLVALLAVLGPGLIAANAGNDAGGIATYASVGAKYGYDLLWMMVLITVSLIVVQEMAARMGAVTGKGLAELIRERYGPRWSLLSTVAVLVANLGICISEFVGIGAALGLAHVPKYASVPIAAAMIWLLVVRGSYKVAERIFVAMTIPFFAYPVAAILAHPHWGGVGRAIVAPHIQVTGPYLFLFIATAGTMENAITSENTIRPPKRSVSMPSGIRPILPSRTGSAMAMLTCTGSRCSCFFRIGIIADTDPKIAKHRANAPVPSASWRRLPRTLLEVESVMVIPSIRYSWTGKLSIRYGSCTGTMLALRTARKNTSANRPTMPIAGPISQAAISGRPPLNGGRTIR